MHTRIIIYLSPLFFRLNTEKKRGKQMNMETRVVILRHLVDKSTMASSQKEKPITRIKGNLKPLKIRPKLQCVKLINDHLVIICLRYFGNYSICHDDMLAKTAMLFLHFDFLKIQNANLVLLLINYQFTLLITILYLFIYFAPLI